MPGTQPLPIVVNKKALSGIAHLDPVPWDAGAKRVDWTASADAPVLAAAVPVPLNMALEISRDGGATWQEVVLDRNVLGRKDHNGQMVTPSVNVQVAGVTHSRVRYEIGVGSLNLGANVVHS